MTWLYLIKSPNINPKEVSDMVLSLSMAHFPDVKQNLTCIDCQQVGCKVFCGFLCFVFLPFCQNLIYFLLLQAWQSKGHYVLPMREWAVLISPAHFLHSVYKHMLRRLFVLVWVLQFLYYARSNENIGLATLWSCF